MRDPGMRRLYGVRAAGFAALACLLFSDSARTEPAFPHANGPYASCRLFIGDSYAQSPLPDFDPANTRKPLAPPPPDLNARVVVCIRTTIVPVLYDYRVLAEMHLPLYIRAEGRIAALD